MGARNEKRGAPEDTPRNRVQFLAAYVYCTRR